MFELQLSDTQMEAEKKAKMYKDYIKILREINYQKVDETTSYVLKVLLSGASDLLEH